MTCIVSDVNNLVERTGVYLVTRLESIETPAIPKESCLLCQFLYERDWHPQLLSHRNL